MTSREIRAALIMKGLKAADIARQIGVSREMVSQVINGRKGSPRVRSAVAAALELPIETIFGAVGHARKAG